MFGSGISNKNNLLITGVFLLIHATNIQYDSIVAIYLYGAIFYIIFILHS